MLPLLAKVRHGFVQVEDVCADVGVGLLRVDSYQQNR